MAEPSKPTALRPLSKIELYSSTRHHLGIYRCVTATCRYQLPVSSPSLTQPILLPALASVVAQQPMLRVGILGQDTSAASFSHVPQIDLSSHAEFQTAPSASKAEYETHVASVQGGLHDNLWPDIETRPPWRVVVVTPGETIFPQPTVDILFAYHHSLADGNGGRTFHETLLAGLNQPSPLASPIISYPDPPSLPEGQDNAVAFTTSIPFMLRVLWTEFAPAWLKPTPKPAWAGHHVDFALAHRTRVRPIDIPASSLAALLAACRTHATTLTGLLHALILLSLARRLSVAEAPFFQSTTPLSLRPYMLPSLDPALKDKMRVLISGHNHDHTAKALTTLRAASSSETEELIWQHAVRVKADLTAHLAKLPADDPISLLKFISDWFSFWRGKDGQPRGTTFEVSNIGVLKNPTTTAGSYRITRCMFTNGSMVAGPAMGTNVASVAGEGLTAALSWQEGVLGEELVQGVAADLETWTARFVETGNFLE